MNLTITTHATHLPAPPSPPGKLEKAAQDFEAVLLGTLLDSLQKTFSGNPEEGPAGSGDYAFMSTQALASAMAARGGIGIARLILSHLRQTLVPNRG